jgi:hypothetical protein
MKENIVHPNLGVEHGGLALTDTWYSVYIASFNLHVVLTDG